MITDRDWNVVEFVTKIPCYTDTLIKLFYPTSERNGYNRLAFLHDYLYLKRTRHGANDRYFYFTKKEPAQKKHLDLLAKTYLWLINNGYTVDILTVQTQIGNIRPDMTCTIERNGKSVIMAVEIQRMFDSEKIKKYEESEFKKLLYVSDKKLVSNKIEVINLNKKELP
jgi:hypothetical protein